MRMFKAMETVDLTFLVLVAAIILGIFILFIGLSSIGIRIGISKQMNVLIDSDNDGTALLAVLKSVPVGVGKGDNRLEQLLDKMDIKMRLYDDNGKVLDEYGKIGAERIQADIALPGGRKGMVEVS